MLSIHADFVDFEEIPFSALFRSVGVYVIWDARQMARPSYIGEGDILRRFATEHSRRFHAPILGYAAILGDDRTKAPKQEAESLESLLLLAADSTDRLPTVNAAPPRWSTVERLVGRWGTIRVRLDGVDPLSPPWKRARSLAGQRITVRPKDDAESFSHPWRRRRKQRA